ncbi:MAG: phage holin family protein [Vicinamibacterales bacterium]
MDTPDLVHGGSIRSLVRGILSDLRILIREELALARVGLREQASRARAAAVSYGIMAAALASGALFLLIAAAVAITDLLEWPVWAGFLTVALLLGAAGLVALASGRRQFRRVHAVPPETVSSLKENAAWIAKWISSGRR